MAMYSNLKNNGAFLIVALTVILALPAHAAATIYKWIDENGQTVYSETPPPPGVERMRIKGASPPAEDPDEVMKKLRGQVQTVEQRRDDQNKTETDARADAERQKQIKENCEILRKNLAVLSSGRRIGEPQGDGNLAYLDEEQRAARLKETQDRINEECP
jgi:hypothetical protein